MRGLQGKVAIVTGGANGIGRAAAERLAEEGCDVVVADLQEDRGAETVAAVEAIGRRAIFVASDATSAESNDSVVDEAVDVFGGVDILVTAAGVAWKNYVSGDPDAAKAMVEAGRGPVDGIVDCDLDEWASVIDVNLTGTLLAVRSAGKQMVAQGRGGSIVTIASIRRSTRRRAPGLRRVEGGRVDAHQAGGEHARVGRHPRELGGPGLRRHEHDEDHQGPQASRTPW